MSNEWVIDLVFDALREAEALHPGWPTDPIHAAAILGEEAGELMQAAIDYTYKDNTEIDAARMRWEAAQCAAMGIRFLLGTSRYQMTPSRQTEIALKPQPEEGEDPCP